jgi:catechol 2,3-dioxygenase-like lactoylglutathione lyase family enzyme
VSLDFHETTERIAPQHYAFLIGERDFDTIFGRIRDRELEHWADPAQSRPGTINHNDGGRGVYFEDPDGHLLEIITRPYGSGG